MVDPVTKSKINFVSSKHMAAHLSTSCPPELVQWLAVEVAENRHKSVRKLKKWPGSFDTPHTPDYQGSYPLGTTMVVVVLPVVIVVVVVGDDGSV
jgi:hypothetical protein